MSRQEGDYMHMLNIMRNFKKGLPVQNRKSVFIRVNLWLTKVFSNRLMQITLISSIHSFPCSLILCMLW